MPDPVITSISERLNLSAEESERVVRALATLIKKQAARDGRVLVPGLGTFARTGGPLGFDPAPDLLAAVNTSFAGLDPVPLSETPETAPAEPPAVKESKVDETVVQHTPPPLPGAAQEKLPVSKVEEEPKHGPPAEKPPRVAAETEKPTSEHEVRQEPPAYKKPDMVTPPPEEAAKAVIDPSPRKPLVGRQPEPEEQKKAPAEPIAAEKEAEGKQAAKREPVAADSDARYRPPVSGERKADAPPSPPPSRPAPKKDINEEKQRSMLPLVILFVLLLLAVPVAVYYFLYLRPANDTAATTAPSETEMALPADSLAGSAEADSLLAAEDSTLIAEGTTPEETETEDPTTAETEAEDPATTETSETSSLRFVPEEGGYTIYVASVPDRDQAERIAEQYRNRLSGQLVPVGILEASAGAGTRYRVAVGQVASLDEALGLIERLGDVLPADAWARRIEPDS